MKFDYKTVNNIRMWFSWTPLVILAVGLALTLIAGLINSGPAGWVGLAVMLWFIVCVWLHVVSYRMQMKEIEEKCSKNASSTINAYYAGINSSYKNPDRGSI